MWIFYYRRCSDKRFICSANETDVYKSFCRANTHKHYYCYERGVNATVRRICTFPLNFQFVKLKRTVGFLLCFRRGKAARITRSFAYKAAEYQALF